MNLCAVFMVKTMQERYPSVEERLTCCVDGNGHKMDNVVLSTGFGQMLCMDNLLGSQDNQLLCKAPEPVFTQAGFL